ncbi:MAG: hypothetical protein K0S32_2917 [Bacteroidetes bacterium]|jgi:hypothetical protein|nr:hypothetical protein [Bacteroidota bacterium]
MKKLILSTLVLVAVVANSAVTVRYINRDSKAYTLKVKIDGSYKEVTFDASKTGSITVQGGATECVLYTNCGEVTLKGGDSVEIKDGCIKK